MQHLTFSERAQKTQQPLAKELLLLMTEKKTNLALSADVLHANQLLELATQLGDEICVLKTHIDIIEDFSPALITELEHIAKQKKIFILEDRKFADIGNTVVKQYQNGIYRIADWANLVTVHSLPGPGIIEGLKSVNKNNHRGCLLLAEMSSANNLLDTNYVSETIKLAKQHNDFVTGFIAQKRLLAEPDFIYFTPGVSLTAQQDNLGQRYTDPNIAIQQNGSDIIIVGRSIINAPSPIDAAKQFRNIAWQAYCARCGL